MNEPTNSKRKFWQFHLSTALILMILAAPFLCPVALLLKEALNPKNIGFPDYMPPASCIYAILVYLPVALLCLYGIGVLCEDFIRRREEHKR